MERLAQQVRSNHPLRPVGTSTDGYFDIAEEDRANHIHVLGTTREGKSKFLEMLLQGDINGGFGATLLDPSDNGQTCYDVLKYCMSKNFSKVCLIDPHDYFFKVPTINPLYWRGEAATDAVVANLMESIRLLWGQTSFDATPRIETYLTAVFTALYATGNPSLGTKRLNCTLPDAIFFSVKENSFLEYGRLKILDCLYKYDEARIVLEEVFNTSGKQLFLTEFKASIRRLSPFFKYLPKHIYGSAQTFIDFPKLIAEGWIILVNLDKTRLWGTAQQRLLGTLVINEIVNSTLNLRFRGWQGTHYLYVDECGQFATRVLSDIMALHGKSGLWATLSHQYYNQFEDKVVLDAVENLCKMKVMFNIPNTTDRTRMIRDMYFGKMKDEAVDSYLNLQKQNCVIKVGKQDPVKTRIRDIDTPKYSRKEVEEFKNSVIYSNSWYRRTDDIRQEIQNRFATTQTSESLRGNKREPTTGGNTKVSKPRKGNDSVTAVKPDTVRRKRADAPAENTAEHGQVRETERIPISRDVRPDFTDVEPARKKRGGQKEPGDKPPGTEGKP